MDPIDEEDPVTKALRKARYNEIVHISLDAAAEEGDVKVDHNEEIESTTTTIDQKVRSLSTKSISLIPRLNEQQGGIQFLNLVDCCRELSTDTDDVEIVLQKELQTKRWFFPMLNDTYRNQCYNDAIKRVIRHVMTNKKDENIVLNVLDIGSGSGLLSLMFAKEFSSYCQNQPVNDSGNDHNTIHRQVHITSVEMSNAFGILAQRTLEENTTIYCDPNTRITIHQGQQSTSPLFNCNTNDASSVNKNEKEKSSHQSIRYDICLSELFEHGLLGEGWIPSIRDAWWRHLSISPPASIIPCGAKVYGAIVKSSWLQNYCRPLHMPHTFTTSFHGTDEYHHTLSLDLNNDDNVQYLLDNCHVMLPVHVNKLMRDKKLAIISNTELIFRLDVSSPNAIPPLFGQTSTVTYSIVTDDICNEDETGYGVLIWWDMVLWEDHDNGNDIIYSLQPNEQQPFQDHWCPCLHLLPTDNVIFNKDDNATISMVDITFRHDDDRIYVENILLHSSSADSVDDGTMDTAKARVKRLKTETCDVSNNSIIPCLPPAYVSQERAYQLNDRRRMGIFQRAIENALLFKHGHQQHAARGESNLHCTSSKSPTITVVDLSDFALGACIAASICKTMATCYDNQYKVISVENSSGHLPKLASQVLSNSIPNLDPAVDLSILQCYNEDITLDAFGTGTQSVDIIFSEPYYEVLEGWHLEEALNYYYTVRLLHRNGIINQSTVVLPGICRVMGCIIESSELRRAYAPCGDSESASICGVQHSYINRIGCNGRGNDIPMHLWQYDYKVLSHTFELGALQYMDPSAPAVPESTKASSSFHTTGRCDALMVWLEYSFAFPSTKTSDPNVDDTILSTNCQSYNQIIQMLSNCEDVSDLVEDQVICQAAYGGNQFESHRFDVTIQRRQNY